MPVEEDLSDRSVFMEEVETHGTELQDALAAAREHGRPRAGDILGAFDMPGAEAFAEMRARTAPTSTTTPKYLAEAISLRPSVVPNPSSPPTGLRRVPPIAEERLFNSGCCDVAVSRYHFIPTIVRNGRIVAACQYTVRWGMPPRQ